MANDMLSQIWAQSLSEHAGVRNPTCSVCNSPLGDKKSHTVHYDVFWPKRFAMPDARSDESVKSALSAKKMLANSPEYLVCEKCIHNFK